MQRFLTYLILIAYLVGGWLLPATHHHASQAETHCHALGAVCCDSTAHSHQREHASSLRADDCGVGAAAASAHPCGCEHEVAVDQPIVDAAISSSQSHSHQCVGLCAACVAQSLVGTDLGDPSKWTGDADVPCSVVADSRLVVSKRYGFALSRGPPAAV